MAARWCWSPGWRSSTGGRARATSCRSPARCSPTSTRRSRRSCASGTCHTRFYSKASRAARRSRGTRSSAAIRRSRCARRSTASRSPRAASCGVPPRIRSRRPARFCRRYRPVQDPTLPRFYGGLVGAFSYDLIRTIEHLPRRPPDDRGFPIVDRPRRHHRRLRPRAAAPSDRGERVRGRGAELALLPRGARADRGVGRPPPTAAARGGAGAAPDAAAPLEHDARALSRGDPAVPRVHSRR